MYQTISHSSLAFLSMQLRLMSFNYVQIVLRICLHMCVCVCVFVHSCVIVFRVNGSGLWCVVVWFVSVE